MLTRVGGTGGPQITAALEAGARKVLSAARSNLRVGFKADNILVIQSTVCSMEHINTIQGSREGR